MVIDGGDGIDNSVDGMVGDDGMDEVIDMEGDVGAVGDVGVMDGIAD